MCISNHRDYIVREYQDGRSSKEIAKDLGCSSSRICQILREQEIEIRFKMKPSKEITLLEPQMVELWNSGLHLESIAKKLKIGAMTVKKRLNKLGIVTAKDINIDNLIIYSNEIINLYIETGSTPIVAEKFNCSAATIQRVLQKNGIEVKKRKLYTVNENFFSNIDNEAKAWIFGLWMSDGCITNRNVIKLQLKDRETIEKVKNLMDYTGPIQIHKQKAPYSPGYFIAISSRRLKEDLIKLGCVENKSLILEYPTKIPTSLISHFIRGLIDGDGCINCSDEYLKDNQPYAKWGVSFIGTLSMMNGIIRDINKNLTINHHTPYKHNKKNDSNTYQVKFNGVECVKILQWIYQDAQYYMERKFQMMLNLIDYYKLKSGEISEFKFYKLSQIKPKREGSISYRIESKKQEILQKRNEGLTVLQIAEIFDCDDTYIYKVLNQAGSNLRDLVENPV